MRKENDGKRKMQINGFVRKKRRIMLKKKERILKKSIAKQEENKCKK